MATKTTLADLSFAEQYLEYLSRKSNPENRARARILLATMEMLDVKHPQWRDDLLAELDRLNIDKDVQSMFPLPEVDDAKLFDHFMSTVLKP
jgi:chromatin segregation and condensation protein Rec8/ScpA/Scc1 (kleisin family)